ncbi:MAG: hypothetical protein JWM53_4468 [bacterium]|nr:hypothetical protein [bacterium]
MRNLNKLGLVLVLAVSTAGCFVAPDPGPSYTGPSGGTGPTQPSPALDAPRPLGLAQLIGYRVEANASAELPAGDLGFVITANGQGGYRVTWSDTYGSAASFTGYITTDGYFDGSQLRGYSGAEDIQLSADGGTVTFSSTPGSYVDGVDVVSSTDPIYLDLRVDGSRSGFGIYFTGAESGAQLSSAYDPVAFTSP